MTRASCFFSRRPRRLPAAAAGAARVLRGRLIHKIVDVVSNHDSRCQNYDSTRLEH